VSIYCSPFQPQLINLAPSPKEQRTIQIGLFWIARRQARAGSCLLVLALFSSSVALVLLSSSALILLSFCSCSARTQSSSNRRLSVSDGREFRAHNWPPKRASSSSFSTSSSSSTSSFSSSFSSLSTFGSSFESSCAPQSHFRALHCTGAVSKCVCCADLQWPNRPPSRATVCGQQSAANSLSSHFARPTKLRPQIDSSSRHLATEEPTSEGRKLSKFVKFGRNLAKFDNFHSKFASFSPENLQNFTNFRPNLAKSKAIGTERENN